MSMSYVDRNTKTQRYTVQFDALIGSKFVRFLKCLIKMRNMAYIRRVKLRENENGGYTDPQIGSTTIHVGFDFKC